MGDILLTQGDIPLLSYLIWLKIVLIRGFLPVPVACKFEEDPVKNDREKFETSFPHYKSMGPSGTTIVLRGPASNQYGTSLPSQQCYISSLIQIGLLILEIFLPSREFT